MSIMRLSKPLKMALYYVLGIIFLTIIWNIALRLVILPRYFVQTEAKVIELRRVRPFTYRGGRQTNQFPVYEYKDDRGETRILESQDGFNSVNGFLLKKEVGQTVKSYYEKGAVNGLFVTATGDWYTFLFAPIVFGIFPLGLVAIAVIYIVSTRNKRALNKN